MPDRFPHRVPVEVIEHIIAYALCPAADDPQKLPTRSSRPHPTGLLLVSLGFSQLALPHFYRTIFIRRPEDWMTLFGTTEGVLVRDKGGRVMPSLDVRQSWVKEMFLGLTSDGDPVPRPLDLEGAKRGFDLDPLVPMNDVTLPNLKNLILDPHLSPPPIRFELELELLTDIFLARNIDVQTYVPPPPPDPHPAPPPHPYAPPVSPALALAKPSVDPSQEVTRSLATAVRMNQQMGFYWPMKETLLQLDTLHFPLCSHRGHQIRQNIYRRLRTDAQKVAYGFDAWSPPSDGPAGSGEIYLPLLEIGPLTFVRAKRELEAIPTGLKKTGANAAKQWTWRGPDGTEKPFVDAFPEWKL